MLLYSTFWIRRRDSCPAVPACPLCAYSCSAGFIHHQTSVWQRHALAKEISFRVLAPPPLPQQAPQGATVGGGDSRASPLQPAAAAPKCCSPRATVSNPAAPSVGMMVCARRREAGGNLLYPPLSSRAMYSFTISLANLLSSMFLASVVS